MTDRSISVCEPQNFKTLILIWGGNSKELGVDSNGTCWELSNFDVKRELAGCGPVVALGLRFRMSLTCP